MELHTKRLKIIPCTENLVLALKQNNEYNVGPHINRYLEEMKIDKTIVGWGPWFVIEKYTTNVVGDIGFKGKPNLENTVEIGYGIIPSAQNKGYGTESVQKIVA